MTQEKQRQPTTQRFQGRGGHMGRGPMAMMPGEKAKNFSGTIKNLVRYLGAYKGTIIFVSLLAIASTVFTILGPRILGRATDELFTGVLARFAGAGDINFNKIGEIILWLAGLYLLSSLFAYFQGYVMAGVSMKLTYRLRDDINAKIHKLPFQFFDKTTHGEVLSRITNDVDTVSQSLNQSLMQLITSAASILGITIMMFTISWLMTLVTMLILPLSAVLVSIIVKKSQKHFVGQQEYLGHVNGHVEEMFAAHIIVRSFNGEQASLDTFSKYNDKLYQSAWKANFLSGLIMPVTGFIGNLAYVAICILGGYFTVNGSMTVGGIQAFLQYVRQFTHPIAQLANVSNVLQQTAAAAERVFEFLAEEEETPEVSDVFTMTAGDRVEGNVRFEHVSFGYIPEKTVVNNFSVQVNSGQRVAIVGHTGAGKTTIVKLLMRFYDVNAGEIAVDGHDIRMFKRDDLRSMFGMVLQDTWLFNGTIADNIRYGRLNATDDDVVSAAKAAQADHFVRTLPDGYNMTLNEEADNISQGQKQLLTIARAILADPEILILDEATSNVDTRTEVMIQTAMSNLMKGRTSFVIAHRLSTIRNADLILVMRHGDIVEQGKHEQLLAQNGFYAELYNSQF